MWKYLLQNAGTWKAASVPVLMLSWNMELILDRVVQKFMFTLARKLAMD